VPSTWLRDIEMKILTETAPGVTTRQSLGKDKRGDVELDLKDEKKQPCEKVAPRGFHSRGPEI
jgi:hypothetical protein